MTAAVATEADPILVEIVAGSLDAIETEVEEAIGRTARSPMVRDQHDYRAGIHDYRLRKLTGRSYSALVHPVVRDFPLDTMKHGDIYFHNDVYGSEGGIGHMPDLCVTVPVFHGGEVVAFVQAFGHHDDIGGSVPGSMPSHATSVYEEGIIVPPVKLFDGGIRNSDVFKIMTRNSRIPESLAGDLDSECAACSMGARRLEELFATYGREQMEACFDAIVQRCTDRFRNDLLAKIPNGSWTWEDYAEHDGVDPPRLHAQRITLTKTDEKLIIDFGGTGPQAKGPINHAGDYADGNFLKKWLAPILRALSDEPSRDELNVNEGVVDLIEMVFPEKGTLLTPEFPAPTNARTFVILRMIGVLAGALAKATGGMVPADQETIRYTGFAGRDNRGGWYFSREILGGGAGGRFYADGSDVVHIVPESRNLPAEFVETRFPLRVEKLALATDSGGAGRFRGGLGYHKEIRALSEGTFMSVADRAILSCWGVKGGMAGKPFKVTVDPGGGVERSFPGLCDREPVSAGELVRIETTGGGGWGDPLDRDVESVRLDVLQAKVSAEAARDDYGVVLAWKGRNVEVDTAATEELRTQLREGRGDLPMFDRGPGFLELSGGLPRDWDPEDAEAE